MRKLVKNWKIEGGWFAFLGRQVYCLGIIAGGIASFALSFVILITYCNMILILMLILMLILQFVISSNWYHLIVEILPGPLFYWSIGTADSASRHKNSLQGAPESPLCGSDHH